MMVDDGKGYILPDVIDPVGSRCVVINIPDDQNHIAAFWGHIEQLSRWYTWKRDDLLQGKDAAEVWRHVIEAARETFLAGECMTDHTQVRANPLNKCDLQYSIDGGLQWMTFARLDDCTKVQLEPPFPEGPTAGPDSAANTATWIDDILCLVVAGIDGGNTDEQILAAASAQINATLPHVDTGPAVQVLIDEFRLLSVAQRADYCGGDIPQGIYDAGVCGQWVSTKDGHWLDNWANTVVDKLNDSSSWLAEAFNLLADQMGIGDQNTISGEGGSGGAAGFGALTCSWSHTFNFEGHTDLLGWFPVATSTAGPGLRDAVGFGCSMSYELDDDYTRSVAIRYTFPNWITLSRVAIKYSYNKGNIPNGVRQAGISWNGFYLKDIRGPDLPNQPTGSGWWEWAGNQAMQGLHIEQRASLTDVTSWCRIFQITLEGPGVNPFT